MKKVVGLEKASILSAAQQKEINGGVVKGWFKCCLTDESFGDPPLGCEAWVIC